MAGGVLEPGQDGDPGGPAVMGLIDLRQVAELADARHEAGELALSYLHSGVPDIGLKVDMCSGDLP